MKRINLSPEREEELINIYSEFLPAERVQVVNFSNCKEAEDCDEDYDENWDENNIVLFQWECNDYRIDYIDRNNKETHICLGAMDEIDAEDRFNSIFPGNIFISAKEIQI